MRTQPLASGMGGTIGAAVLLVVGAASAWAQQAGGAGGPTTSSQANAQSQQAPRGEAAKESHDPLITPDPLAPVFAPWDDLKAAAQKQLDLRIDAGYTFLYQNATNVIGDKHDLFQGRLDLGGEWTLLRQEKDTGSIGFLVRSGRNIGSSQQFALQPAVGDILGIDSLQGGGEQESITINLLYWRQSFFDDRLAIYVGKLHPNQYIDLSFVANDESNQFLAGTFDGNSSNPVEGAYTPGVAVEAKLSERVYVHALAVDSQGRADTGLQTLGEGKLYEAAELGYQPQVEGMGKGSYRIGAWHTEASDGQQGAGVQLGFDQEIGGGWAPFARWGYGNPDVSAVQQVVAGGMGNLAPFGRRGDMWGLGIAYAVSSDRSLRNETLIETFYRLRLTDSLELSPDVELLIPPADANNSDVVAIFGLRLKALF